MNDADLKDPEFESAVAVSDHLLAVTGQAYLSRNVDMFLQRFLLPQTVGTFKGEQVVETPDDFRALFKDMCAHFDTIGLIELNRKTISAKFLEPHIVQATFSTQYITRGYTVSEESFGHGHLRLDRGLWKIANNNYATTSDAITNVLLGRERTASRTS